MKLTTLLLGLTLFVSGCNSAPTPTPPSSPSTQTAERAPAANPAPPAGDSQSSTGSSSTTAETPKTPPTPPASANEGSPSADKKPQAGQKRTVAERMVQLNDLKKAKITIGKKTFNFWLMDDDDKRTEGMMHLEASDIADDEGMLFVFPNSEPRAFWMKNCHFDLDVAFIAPNGKILNTERMFAYNENGVPSKGDAMYVLEMRYGMFAKWGIKAGMKVVIPETVVSK